MLAKISETSRSTEALRSCFAQLRDDPNAHDDVSPTNLPDVIPQKTSRLPMVAPQILLLGKIQVKVVLELQAIGASVVVVSFFPRGVGVFAPTLRAEVQRPPVFWVVNEWIWTTGGGTCRSGHGKGTLGPRNSGQAVFLFVVIKRGMLGFVFFVSML